MSLHRPASTALVIATLLAGCADGKSAVSPTEAKSAPDRPSSTLSSGSASTLLGRSTFADPHDQTFKVKRSIGDWDIDIKAKPAFDLAVQSIDFAPGAQSGWHSHPGPVFIQVVSGSITFYEGDDPTCTPVVKTAGQGFLDVGDHAHLARNEGATPARNIVTYFAPPGAPLRIDQPNPGNCSF